jgi:hypothetical protein
MGHRLEMFLSVTVVYLDPILRLGVFIGDSLRSVWFRFFEQIHYMTTEIRPK